MSDSKASMVSGPKHQALLTDFRVRRIRRKHRRRTRGTSKVYPYRTSACPALSGSAIQRTAVRTASPANASTTAAASWTSQPCKLDHVPRRPCPAETPWCNVPEPPDTAHIPTPTTSRPAAARLNSSAWRRQSPTAPSTRISLRNSSAAAPAAAAVQCSGS